MDRKLDDSICVCLSYQGLAENRTDVAGARHQQQRNQRQPHADAAVAADLALQAGQIRFHRLSRLELARQLARRTPDCEEAVQESQQAKAAPMVMVMPVAVDMAAL